MSQIDNLENAFEKAEEVTPEKLAKLLFSKLPDVPCTISLLTNSEDTNTEEVIEFNFEILLSIYMEGIIDAKRLVEMLTFNKSIEPEQNIYQNKINLSEINLDVLDLLKPWFLSIGYMVNIHEFNATDNIIEDLGLENYYCKIILRENPEDFGVFFMKQINKPYHFILNGKFNYVDNLADLFAIFYLPKNKKESESQKKLYTISFSPFSV